MKTFTNAIKAVEKVTTKKEKIQALQGLSLLGKRLMVEALSPYRVFGIRSILCQ